MAPGKGKQLVRAPGKGKQLVGEPNLEIDPTGSDDDSSDGLWLVSSDSDSSDSDSPFTEQPDLCFSWKLNHRDVNPKINQLYLPAQIASTLLGNPKEILENPNSRSFSKRLTVFDDITEYDMVLTSCPIGGVGGFMITEDWHRFVWLNQLQAGDQVAFEKTRDSEGKDDYVYLLSCLKTQETTSRCEPSDEACLSLLLTPPNVTGPIPILHLSPRDVKLLMGGNMAPEYLVGPSSVKLLMRVYKDRTYSMTLSSKVVHGGRNAVFTLNTTWGIFLKDYDLRVDDTVYFFRSSKGDNCNYILKFIKTPRFKPYPPKPTSSSEGPKEDKLCLSRTLPPSAVDSSMPSLYVDAYETFLLTRSSQATKPLSAKNRMKLIAYDDYGVCYKLQLTKVGNLEGYLITQDWGEFVRVNNLKAGDDVKFYRKPYTANGCAFCYIKFHRKPSDGDLTEVPVTGKRLPRKPHGSTDQHKKKAGPGSRVISDDQPMCFSTFLSADEVGSGGETPKLAMDAYRAGYMIACYDVAIKYPLGKLRENLVVYDIDDRKYDMLLTHRLKNGNLVYYLDAGWQRFVEVHCLRAGDVVSMFKFVDPTVQDEPFFVIRFRKMGDGGKAGPGGDGGEMRKPVRGIRIIGPRRGG